MKKAANYFGRLTVFECHEHKPQNDLFIAAEDNQGVLYHLRIML